MPSSLPILTPVSIHVLILIVNQIVVLNLLKMAQHMLTLPEVAEACLEFNLDPNWALNFDPNVSPDFNPTANIEFDPNFDFNLDPNWALNFDPNFYPDFDAKVDPDFDPNCDFYLDPKGLDLRFRVRVWGQPQLIQPLSEICSSSHGGVGTDGGNTTHAGERTSRTGQISWCRLSGAGWRRAPEKLALTGCKIKCQFRQPLHAPPEARTYFFVYTAWL